MSEAADDALKALEAAAWFGAQVCVPTPARPNLEVFVKGPAALTGSCAQEVTSINVTACAAHRRASCEGCAVRLSLVGGNCTRYVWRGVYRW